MVNVNFYLHSARSEMVNYVMASISYHFSKEMIPKVTLHITIDIYGLMLK